MEEGMMLIRGSDSAIDLPSILTEEEKWYFDLQGYLILRQVITADEINQMLRLGSHWLEQPDQAPLAPSGNGERIRWGH